MFLLQDEAAVKEERRRESLEEARVPRAPAEPHSADALPLPAAAHGGAHVEPRAVVHLHPLAGALVRADEPLRVGLAETRIEAVAGAIVTPERTPPRAEDDGKIRRCVKIQSQLKPRPGRQRVRSIRR